MATQTNPIFEVDRTSMVDQVADRLRVMIWRGELPQGYHLKEMQLAKSFGVSRNTIRDAIRDLTQDGLLTHELHRGAVVRELDAEDVADLYRVRRLLETSGTEKSEPSESELGRIRDAVVGIERAVTNEDWDAAVAADREFHSALVAMLRSSRLTRFFEQISAESRFALGILWLEDAAANEMPDVLAQVAAEHRAIYEAIASGDRSEARELLEAHLTINETRVLEILEARVPAAT